MEYLSVIFVGCTVGFVGNIDGPTDGVIDGVAVRFNVATDGLNVGLSDGDFVGCIV